MQMRTKGVRKIKNHQTTRHLPAVGMRMIKTAAAVFLCLLVYVLRGGRGAVFHSVVSTVFCMQSQVEGSKKAAFDRLCGTCIGTVYGTIVLVVEFYIVPFNIYDSWIGYVFTAAMIIPVIYTTVYLKVTSISYFACVVFLSITVARMGDTDTFTFIINRVADTLIGVGVALVVNYVKLPRKHHNNILFISGLDDTLLSMNDSLLPYSKVELNRMIQEGANFTLSTQRSPASLVDVAREVKLKWPVIAMDGAVLYDTRENAYLKVYLISNHTVRIVAEVFDSIGVHYFINSLLGDTVLTYCSEEQTEIEAQIYEKYRKSPYRHYVKAQLPNEQDAISMMIVDNEEKIAEICEYLQKQECLCKLKINIQEVKDFPGYFYLRIYNKNALKKNMIQYLKDYVECDQVVTFGTVEGKYDVVLKENDSNEVVKSMKRLYKPYVWVK